MTSWFTKTQVREAFQSQNKKMKVTSSNAKPRMLETINNIRGYIIIGLENRVWERVKNTGVRHLKVKGNKNY
jgi:hypothetical protein